jgi:hypothetical protein
MGAKVFFALPEREIFIPLIIAIGIIGLVVGILGIIIGLYFSITGKCNHSRGHFFV